MDDGGFSVLELMTAMAVFSILMIMVGAAVLTGLSSIKDIGTRSSQQADAQNAAEWISRQLRYADAPENVTWPIVAASPTEISFYTYSGSGAKHDVPYLVRLFVTTTTGAEITSPCAVTTVPTSGAKWKNLCASVTTPRRTVGGWEWYPSPSTLPQPFTRQLMRVPAANGSPLSLAVYAGRPDTVPLPSPSAVTPSTLGALPLTVDVDVPEYVVVQIGDPTEPDNVVTQQVRLENQE